MSSDVVRARGGKADLENAVAAATGVKDDAAAPIAVRVDKRRDRSIDAGLAERGDDQVTLPAAIARLTQMLYRAAAAHAEMPADRLDALCTRLPHIDQTAAVGVAGHGVDFDAFARQRSGDVNRSFGAVSYSVAMLPQPADQKLFNHAPPR